MIDDLVDTAGTLCSASAVLKERGATKVVAYITHPVLSGPAVERLEKSVLDELVVTDTIPLKPAAAACSKIRQLSVSRYNRGRYKGWRYGSRRFRNDVL
jgi:ribose-phosphate pyrophosphokinase